MLCLNMIFYFVKNDVLFRSYMFYIIMVDNFFIVIDFSLVDERKKYIFQYDNMLVK